MTNIVINDLITELDEVQEAMNDTVDLKTEQVLNLSILLNKVDINEEPQTVLKVEDDKIVADRVSYQLLEEYATEYIADNSDIAQTIQNYYEVQDKATGSNRKQVWSTSFNDVSDFNTGDKE